MVLKDFHPAVEKWFQECLGKPSAPQERAWPAIQKGENTLIAAPTGSGKTLAAFLAAINHLFLQGDALERRTQVLYVSPLRALSNDIQKNLQGPLQDIRKIDPDLPEIEVMVRTGDTPQKERAAMTRKHPHILVTTPESLYILLTSASGRQILSDVRTIIIDEIHALIGDKRGSHLALSLERLEVLTDGLQRIGLSATQKPLTAVGAFLVGFDRPCTLIDEGFLRHLEVAIEIPPSPLSAVCSHETWGEIYLRMADLIHEHTTTLIFVGTRKLAERIAAELTKLLGEDHVACHHSSMAKDRRLDAEQRLKTGKLRALVATASLELGIDIGDIDLVIQVGATRSIATFLQRIGRAGHSLRRIPKGRIFPLTQDELVEGAALLRSVRTRTLDRTPQPVAPLDILAQQVVAACAAETWDEDELYHAVRKAWPYRNLSREDFDQAVRLHTDGRYALLHRDGVQKRLRGTRRARIPAMTSGGAIPDTADYQVVLDPDGTVVGTLNEDFAIESNRGDIFQLGNASWRILQVSQGVVRVADAHGQPPTLPFWLNEGPSRTAELAGMIGEIRECGLDRNWLEEEIGLPREIATELTEYLQEGKEALGAVPTQKRVILERFFDETGGMQLVIHAPYGGRINRAWGLALRKRFCRHFGFELQAAANEEAIVLSLGPQHSFPLQEVFDYLSPATAREVLTQALLATPLFTARWRWNVTRSLLVERMRNGKKVPAALLRMRADDQLAQAFPDAVACGENLPAGDLEIPMHHPLVRQTVEDGLTEAMDVDGFIQLLEDLKEDRIEKISIDTAEPSAFARGILSAQPYSFLDDAPLEERRTQAVYARRVLDNKTADELGALDPAAVARVRQEAWPDPRNAEEVHEALCWMGYVDGEEASSWLPWLEALTASGRAVREQNRWYATETNRDPKNLWKGRLEVLGPVFSDDPILHQLEQEGSVLRCRLDGRQAWCERRLLARILRYTLESLRAEIQPVQPADYLGFLTCWQHLDSDYKLEGPHGVAEVLHQLAGFEAPVAAWDRKLLGGRIRDYQPDWLDQLGLRGEFMWSRLWGSGHAAVRATPIAFFPREKSAAWFSLTRAAGLESLSWRGKALVDALQKQGASFTQDLRNACGPLASDFESGLQELVGRGCITSDSFASVRQLLLPSWKRRKQKTIAIGRWSLIRETDQTQPVELEWLAKTLLKRWGVLFRRLMDRERIPIFWRDLARVCRTLELRGEIRGGRFVEGFSGEQFALPEAVEMLRKIRRDGPRRPVNIAAADPLNLQGILTSEERVPTSSQKPLQINPQPENP